LELRQENLKWAVETMQVDELLFELIKIHLIVNFLGTLSAKQLPIVDGIQCYSLFVFHFQTLENIRKFTSKVWISKDIPVCL
jgi:hypothetical protein